MTTSSAKPNAPEATGLNGITRSSGGDFFEVRNANGYQKLTKDQMSQVHKATNGDSSAKEALERQGITLVNTNEDKAAELRGDLVAAGSQKFQGNKKGYTDFIKQQDDFGGNHKTSGQVFANLAGFLPGLQMAGVINQAALGKHGNNAHGVFSITGPGGKLFTITRTDGKSPTSKDIDLGTKAAGGLESAKSEAAEKGLIVAEAKEDAGKLLEPPIKAGSMGGGNTRV